VEAKVAAELAEQGLLATPTSPNPRPVAWDDLIKLTYLNAVIKVRIGLLIYVYRMSLKARFSTVLEKDACEQSLLCIRLEVPQTTMTLSCTMPSLALHIAPGPTHAEKLDDS
jgi:hypothetical protein